MICLTESFLTEKMAGKLTSDINKTFTVWNYHSKSNDKQALKWSGGFHPNLFKCSKTWSCDHCDRSLLEAKLI